ncbi:uncharacterized protein LOC143498921 [Brachyhypopomus gauderio]|uniref:uncharacterized protein LOC143498921 n=1 Tax=Brachyhypopomus gauderio TaxID=698409 RepID=UPI0040429B1E
MAMRRLQYGPCSEHARCPSAWTFSASRGLQLHVSTRARVAPLGTQKTRRTQSTHDCRLPSSPVANGKRPCLSRVFLRSGNPTACAESLLLACGKQCVLSPRPSRGCPSGARQAEDETALQAEGSRGEEGPAASSESRQTPPTSSESRQTPPTSSESRQTPPTAAWAPGGRKERVRSSVAGRSELPTVARRPNTAPARAQTRHRDLAQLPAEAPSCRVVWRRRPGENTNRDSLDGATPALHLYLPGHPLPDGAYNTTDEENSSSENDKGLDNRPNKQLDIISITSTSQKVVTTCKQQQDITTAQRQHDTRLSDQDDTTDRNGEHCTGTGKECDITEDDERYDITGQPEEKHGKGDGRQDLTEDRKQHDITQNTLSDITNGEENNPSSTRDDIRHDYTQDSDDYTQDSDDYTQDSGQLDVRRERGEACDVADGNRQQGCGENNGSGGTIVNSTEPDFSNSTLQHIKTRTQGSEKNNLSQTSMDNQDRGQQQVLENRGNVTPRQLGFGGVQVRAAHTSSLSSESQRLERSFLPVPTVVIPSTITLTPPHTPITPAAFPSYCRTFFGYRIRMFHTSELLYPKTQTTRVGFKETVIKPTKKLPHGPQSTGTHCASKEGIREITRRPKIMRSLPCKVKTTKTFVWGSWGPLETKSVCELHIQNYRCQSSE